MMAWKELFMAEMGDKVLQMAPPSLFGPLVAIPAPHLGQPTNEVTCTMADLGEAEAKRAQKAVQSAERKGLKGPMRVTRIQTWFDRIKAVADKEKLEGKSNKILLEL